jgi:spermidine/putrescine transport system substrate-binding protein
MSRFWRLLIFIFSLLVINPVWAMENILNLYTWSGVIPESVIHQFEKETGIKVNFSTYDSNEIMYAKLKVDKNSPYDIVEPSSYYIDRMHRQDMLRKIIKSKLSHFKNLYPHLLNGAYDPKNDYSIPFIWGTSGIFINKNYHAKNSITRWADFWESKYAEQILLLDDTREVFGMALCVLGYPINDDNPEHIKQAYLKLKALLPNVKVFNSAPISILIDEDATMGMIWNGDLFNAKKENSQLEYIYPEDGFSIWVDNFAIPKNAPHLENAYKFLDFMLRADIAKAAALYNNYATPNLAAQKQLPKSIQDNSTIYPSRRILNHGQFETDIKDDALALYEKYWELLKMGG